MKSCQLIMRESKFRLSNELFNTSMRHFMNFFVQIIWFLKRKVEVHSEVWDLQDNFKGQKKHLWAFVTNRWHHSSSLCVFQIIVGCRGVKNDLFVVLHRMYCTYVAMPKTEGNERGVKIIPTFLRRHAKYKVSQRKIHIF